MEKGKYNIARYLSFVLLNKDGSTAFAQEGWWRMHWVAAKAVDDGLKAYGVIFRGAASMNSSESTTGGR
jgi:hypothetical protein